MSDVCGITAVSAPDNNENCRIRPDGLPFGKYERGLYIENGKLNFKK